MGVEHHFAPAEDEAQADRNQLGIVQLVDLGIERQRGTADPAGGERGRPMTFLGAAAFQWVNVKGWVIAVGTITAYAAVASYPWNILILSALLLAVGLTSSTVWVLFGSSLQSLVRSPRAVRIFNITMALLLLASLYPVLMEP